MPSVPIRITSIPVPGADSVNLTVTNASGSNSLKRTNYITVSAPPSPPVAAFTGNPVSGNAPLGVAFTDSSSGTSLTNWRWDFGDGNITNYAVRTHPYHIYSGTGLKSVNLTVTGSGGTDSEVKTNYINVTLPPPPPTAAFTGNPVSGNAPLAVTFTDSSSGTSLTNWRWDFGDGNISNYAVRTHPYHIYSGTGLKSVNLTVTGSGGTDSEVKTNYINVTTPPPPPTAAFTGVPLSGTAPLGVTFTDSSSGTLLTNWRWDFGDGNITNYAVRTHPYHIYASAGSYSVNLTVTNTSGSNSLRRTNYITVSAPPSPPVASFTANPLSGTVPLRVTFTDSSTGTSLTNWRWDFGDGNISQYGVSTNPFHIYESSGLKTVNLTVTGSGGTDSEVRTNFIDVITPEADFSGTPLTGVVPLGVAFTDNSAGASITNWRWDFGDGNISEYTVRTDPFHIYESAGLKTINLTVTWMDGTDSEVKTNYIDVLAQEADFSGTPVYGIAPLGVMFTDRSQGSSITSWRWDFGDGNISEYSVRTDPFHVYESSGLKSVNLTVTGTEGTDSEVKTDYIEVMAQEADFSGTPVYGVAPHGVMFTDRSQGSSITSWRWDFGDSNISEYNVQTHPYHLYESAGSYSINLTVTGTEGTDSEVKTDYIEVTGPATPPTAAFIGTPDTGTLPLGVLFTDSSSGTSITNWRWDFGDGNISEYSVRTDPFHLYESPGLKSINLTVTGTEGTYSETKINYINVTAPVTLPTAAFSGTPVMGTVPLGVVFTDNSSGTLLTNWRWDFGDGNISEYGVSTNPFHLYESAGLKSINLTVSGLGGTHSEVKTNYINVTDLSTGIGVFRSTSGMWYLDTTKTGVVNTTFRFGKPGDVPVVGDWDGNGISDIGVFRSSSGMWYLDTTRTGIISSSFRFGKPEDVPVVGDWDGNGISDVGVFRSSTGMWYLDTTRTGIISSAFPFGKPGDVPVVGDWDGNGISDVGVFRSSVRMWYLDTTRTGVIRLILPLRKNGRCSGSR